MRDVLKSQALPPLLLQAYAQGIDGTDWLDEFRVWANGELDKIILSARLVGVLALYMPTAEGRKVGMRERTSETPIGCECHVDYIPLMGLLWFQCEPGVMIKKIRIPGINAEWRHYESCGQEQVDIIDTRGMTRGIECVGPHRFKVFHSTGRDHIA